MDHARTTPSLLIAAPQLQDPNFIRTVLLLLEFNADGAFGLVINRPSTVGVKDLVKIPGVEPPKSMFAWFGGPVGKDSGIVLHNDASTTDPDVRRLNANVFLSSTLITLKEMVAKSPCGDASENFDEPTATADGPLYPYRFIVGYAGWGPGQLDEELKQGAWIQAPLTTEVLFEVTWSKMWEHALSSIGISPIGLAPVEHSFLN